MKNYIENNIPIVQMISGIPTYSVGHEQIALWFEGLQFAFLPQAPYTLQGSWHRR